MLDDKPVLYEAPEVPTDWDYDKSVDAMATRLRSWKSLTAEILSELYVAREILSRPGSHESGWGDYCEAIGLPQRTANRWLQRSLVGDAEDTEEALPGTGAREEEEEVASHSYPMAEFTGNEEWYTPPQFLDAARDALTWDKWPECEAMSRPTGAERLTLAAATQRHAPNMAALGRRSPERKRRREAMSRPTIDGIVGSITDTTGAGRPRSRATGGQRELKIPIPGARHKRFCEVLEPPHGLQPPNEPRQKPTARLLMLTP